MIPLLLLVLFAAPQDAASKPEEPPSSFTQAERLLLGAPSEPSNQNLRAGIELCEQGTVERCEQLLRQFETRGDTRVARATELAVRWRSAQCDEGDSVACVRLGLLLGWARSPERDERRGRAAFSRAFPGLEAGCKKKEGAADCLLMGRLLVSPWSGVADPNRGRDVLLQGCVDGEPDACEVVAGEYRRRGLKDEAETLESIGRAERQCAAGNDSFCVQLAAKLETAVKRPAAKGRALDLYRGLCAMPSYEAETACAALVRIYRDANGRGEAPDGRSLLRAPCERGTAPACLELGKLLVREPQSQTERDEAAKLLSAACTKGENEACTILGRPAPAPPRPVAPISALSDRWAAMTADARRACDMGVRIACDQTDHPMGVGPRGQPRSGTYWMSRVIEVECRFWACGEASCAECDPSGDRARFGMQPRRLELRCAEDDLGACAELELDRLTGCASGAEP